MPPEIECPYCGTMVPDWHFEWHSQADQSDIFGGRQTMECPWCRAGVSFDGFAVSKAESQPTVAKRDLTKAARSARIQSVNLREYLQTKEGEPFRACWSEAEVEAADRQAAESS